MESEASTNENASSEWARGWPIPLLSTLGVAVSVMHTYTLGALMPSIQAATGWTRSQISTGPILISITGICFAPLVGIAIDRYGARRVALPGLVLYCLAFAALGFTGPRSVSWFVGWTVVGVAFVLVSPTVWTAAVVAEFDRSRGKAIGLALAGTGVGSICLPYISTILQEHYGWRGAYERLGIGALLISFPLIWLFFYGSQDRLRLSSATFTRQDRKTLGGVPAREAFLSRRYLQMAFACLLASTSGAAMAVHFVPIVRANGLSAHTAAAIAAGIGFSSVTGRLLGGYLLDHASGPLVGFIACACGILVAPALLLSHGAGPGLFGACMVGLSAGMEIAVLAYMIPRYFGVRHYGLLFAVINGLVIVGLGVGPFAGGYLFDDFGNYRILLLLTAPTYAASAVLFGTLGSPTRSFAPSASTGIPELSHNNLTVKGK
jgi:MFS family permease